MRPLFLQNSILPFYRMENLYNSASLDNVFFQDIFTEISLKFETSKNVINDISYRSMDLINTATITGTIGNDTLLGTGDNDFIDGLAGNDTLSGLGLNDVLNGGTGNDTLFGGTGNDRLEGDEDDDILWGGEGDDLILGGNGNDIIYAGPGNDAAFGAFGEAGDDTFIFQDDMGTENFFSGGDGYDVIDARQMSFDPVTNLYTVTFSWTSSDFDEYLGGGGDDRAFGNFLGDQRYILGAGDDIVGGSEGNDFYNGQAGNDQVSYFNSTSAVTVNLVTGVHTGGFAEGDTLISIECISGSEFDDNITGNGVDNQLLGNGGADILNGGGGDDIIFGNEGNGTNIGSDTINGGNGFDIASYAFNANSVTINLTNPNANSGEADGDTYSSIEAYEGSQGDDTLIGSAGDDDLRGNAGDDVLNGLEGEDILDGGAGNDTLRGGVRDDILNGGEGDDILLGESFNDILNGGEGNDILQGGGGDDVLRGDEGNDRIFAQAGDDIAYGGTGDDRLVGALGDDELFGQSGNDILIGGGGEDQIHGGLGDDRMVGQQDADVFYFDDNFGDDIIVDFEDGIDIMDFSNHSTVNAFADLTLSQLGTNVLIENGTDSILVRNTDVADLTAADFSF